METRFTGIAHGDLTIYQPLSLEAGEDDYTVIPATADTIAIGYADVPTEDGARVPICTTFCRANIYAGAAINYADPLSVTTEGEYLGDGSGPCVGYALSTVTTKGDLVDALLSFTMGSGGAGTSASDEIVFVDVTVAGGAASGATAAAPTLVGATVMGVVAKTAASKIVQSVAVAGDGAITVTLAAAAEAGVAEVYTVSLLKA